MVVASRQPTAVSDVSHASTRTGADDELDAKERAQLRGTQTASLLAHTSPASVISTVAALILAMYLVPAVGRPAAYAWFGLKLAAAVPRFAIGLAWKRRLWQADMAFLNRLVLVSLAVDGVVWGMAGVWCASRGTETTAGLLLGCLSSVAMLATFGLQVQQTATAAYVVPIMVPLGLALAARGDVLGVTGAGGALLVLIQTLVTGYASERRVTREFVAQEKLRKALLERSDALQMASETSNTLQEALVELQRQSAVKALFLGTMSHELRTPLHGILGLTDMVRTKTTDEDVKRKLDLVRSSADHLLELIGALLDVSRIDSGKIVLHEAPFDLVKELGTMEELYSVRADSKGIGFCARITVGRSCWVHGDAGRLRQILHNLLGNAIKFTKRGLVTMIVEERKMGSFFIEVIDTGPGIASDELPHIFEAFRQTKESAPRTSEGTGLGLTIARELAKAMGGDISVSSAVGLGSRFTFEMHLSHVESSQIPMRTETAPLPRLKQRFRVLVVEDNEVNAMIAEAHLDRMALISSRARDGKEAVVAAFADPRPDLILMDCRMPLLDGPGATREIRRLEEESCLPRVPIIALTATTSEEEKAECFGAGMDGFLEKPFTDQQLLRAIQAYVEQEQETRQREHPLYEFAIALEDSDSDVLHGRNTVH